MTTKLPETTEIEIETAWKAAGFVMDRWGMTDEDSCVCGSIRRLEPIVGDIDILAPRPSVPKIDPMHDLIAKDLVLQADWDGELPKGKFGICKEGLKPGFGRVRCLIRGRDGSWLKVEIHRYKLKLSPSGRILQSNRGWIQMIRTGPADWSKNMMIRWKSLTNGGTSKDGFPVTPLGVEFYPATEADAFALLRLPYCPPGRRASMRFDLNPPADPEYVNPPRYEDHGTLATTRSRFDRNGNSGKGRGRESQKPAVHGPDHKVAKVASPLFNS